MSTGSRDHGGAGILPAQRGYDGRPAFAAVGAALLFLAGGAPAGAAAKRAANEVTRLEVSPPALHLYGRGAADQVFVTAVRADGRRQDVTDRAVLRATGPQVKALAGGAIVARGDGSATVKVSFNGVSAPLPVTASGTAAERRVSFRYDVLPVISRAGCNQGSCHGNSEGRGGLKLSLKAEDPDHDYAVLVRHAAGRRVNRTDPGASLVLLKATAAVPHGGGRRFPVASEEYRMLARWIAEGARPDPGTAPRLLSVELSPTERVLVQPAWMQRLTVLGRFSDGSIRNLARKVVYSASDPTVEVTPDGKIEMRSSADVAVMVRYADQLVSSRLTFVPARESFSWKPAAANNWIDECNFGRLKLLRLEPSRLTTDAEFLRRAYLDGIGLLPSPDEVRTFLADRSTDKRAKLIDTLLQHPGFDDYWTLIWADLLRVEERSLDPTGAGAYRQWIRDSIHGGKPLNQFARELLEASGSTYKNPPANYYRRTRTPIELAETTAQVFLGTRMLCAKCHNHPFERWKQDDYFALAAYFARIDRKIENLTRRDKFDLHELNGEETISVAKNGEVEQPRTGQSMPPHLPIPGARVPAVLVQPVDDRRIPLAEWLTSRDNPYFARAMVNRIWYHVVGRGIVDPVDDMRETNPPSNPQLLDRLAKEFAGHNFDLRYLVRTIMNSRTYQLASEPNSTNADDERFFSRAVPRRIPAEVLLDAISQATGAAESFDGQPAGTRAVQAAALGGRKRPAFLKLFGQPQRESVCECERTNETTLGQSFALISGDSLDRKLRSPDNRIGELLKAGKTNAAIVTEFYLATVSRPPTPKEIDSAERYVAGKPDRRAALEDVLWALLNSKEFLLRR